MYSVRLTLINNSNVEQNRTFTVTFSSLVGLRFSDGLSEKTYEITIVDDDSTTLSITNRNFSVDEDVDRGNFVVNLSLSGTTEVDVPVVFTLTSGTEDPAAILDTDFSFTRTNGAVITSATILAGQRTGTFLISIANDSISEFDETFTFSISAIGTKIASGSTTKTITIIDNELPVVHVANSVSVGEDIQGGNLKLVVRLNKPTDQVVEIKYHTGDANGNDVVYSQDFTAISFANSVRVTFNSGEIEKRIQIAITNDSVQELTESFRVKYSIGQYRTAEFPNSQVESYTTVSIIDDETPKIDISASTYIVPEEHGRFSAELMIDKTFSETFTFDLEIGISGDSATFNSDFRRRVVRSQILSSSSVTLSFGLSALSIPISLDILDDPDFEEDEIITFRFSNLTSTLVQFANGEDSYSKTLTIVDDESTIVTFSDTDLSIDEGETTQNELGQLVHEFIAVVGLSRSTAVPVSFRVSLAGSTSSPATSGTDFTFPASRPFTISPGSTEVRIPIPIVNDSIHEKTESFTISLTSLKGANFLRVNGIPKNTITTTVEITDDDEPILVIPDNPIPFLIAENSPNDQFILNLPFSKALLFPITVTIETTSGTAVGGGNAIAGEDFTTISGPTSAISSTTDKLPIPIPLINDTNFEENESFNFRITGLKWRKIP